MSDVIPTWLEGKGEAKPTPLLSVGLRENIEEITRDIELQECSSEQATASILRLIQQGVPEKNTFTYEYLSTQEEVRQYIQSCEGKHTQQAIYSTFHDALTQVCFGCKKIRSTIRR